MDKSTIEILKGSIGHLSTYGTQGEKGTGLGLMLSKELILKNGGELLIERRIGEGSSFTVVLPKRIA